MHVGDLFKFQLLADSHGQHAHAQSGALPGMDAFFAQMWSLLPKLLFLIFMGVSDELIKQLPHLLSAIKHRYMDRFMQHQVARAMQGIREVPISETAIMQKHRHFLNCLTMTRVYGNGKAACQLPEGVAESNRLVDALLAHVSKLDNVPEFRLVENNQLLINYADKPVELGDNVYLQLSGKRDTSVGGALNVSLLSNTQSAAQLGKYLRRLYEQHQIDIRNAMGETKFYFDQKAGKGGGSSSDPRGLPSIGGGQDAGQVLAAKRMAVSTAVRQLSFMRTPFISNKSFSNIFGKQVREVERRVKFFVENRAWYDRHGIPYQLGILLSGMQGSGKTSIIRAIANYTKRHIVCVNFASLQTATQLKSLFHEQTLHTFTDNACTNCEDLVIPVSQRLYVMEEIDTLGAIVQQRQATDVAQETVPDELTLGEILCALDGTLEVPGRLLVITSNHPELLDRALIRPGRVDVSVRFTRADRALICEMYEAFFEAPIPDSLVPLLPDNKLTPAEVSQIFFRHFGSDGVCAKATVDDLVSAMTHEESLP